MNTSTHLSFGGNCSEAFHFYVNTLGCKLEMIMTYGDSPAAAQVEPSFKDKVIHASLNFGETRITGADAPPDRFQKPQGFHVMLDIKDVAEAERVYAALSEGGSVMMPLAQTFWAQRFAMLTDRFGTPWMINCGNPA